MRVRFIPTPSSAASAATATYQAANERVHGVGARGAACHLEGLSGHAQLQHQQNSRSVKICIYHTEEIKPRPTLSGSQIYILPSILAAVLRASKINPPNCKQVSTCGGCDFDHPG